MTVATKKLHELADVFSGYAFKSKDLGESGIPVVKIKNVNNKIVSKQCDQFLPDDLVTERLKKYLLQQSDILVAMTGQGSLGRIGKMTNQQGQYIVNQRVGIVRPKCEDDSIADYLFGVLALDEFEQRLYSLGAGAGQPNVSAIDIGNLDIPYPSKSSRDFIAKARANYDNLIENNNRRIAILEDMAQSLYREWFVKFRYLGYQDNLDADGSPKLVDSPLGQIPEGWEVKRLDDFVTLQRGFDLPKKKRNEKGCVPIYAASGINGYHDQVKAKGPGIVTGRSGTLGIVNLVLEDHWPLNTSLWVKEFKGCTAFYAYYLLDSIGLERFNSGASVPTLNRNDVHGNPVIAPPKELIEKFENIVCVNHKQINVLKRKNENLKKQRDMLLPKLISGEIEL
ncbi:restriction endonuclease subunit S [Vibrio sp. J2-4]|uniref:restriction endonuclease subunit S n=1 Tax=Vibrio sp. J2-4 TaxID=1507977 RepID=UPI001F025182|nr:restriction endonuclease subunit S [Vibrio sp. J2-4]MCF7478390.1 restriction endonuclease subunit S [Vibrio sp. J2-4]